MSGRVAGKVWDSDLHPDLKPLAAVLADHGQDDGTQIYPSVARMAWRLGRSTRCVQEGLSKLRKLGILVVVSGGKGGRSKTTKYRLEVSRLPARPSWQNPAVSSRFQEPDAQDGVDFHRQDPRNHEPYDAKPRTLQHETTSHSSPEALVELLRNRNPRAQTRSAKNRFDEGMEKQRRFDAQQKRLIREEAVKRELKAGTGPQ
jgi:hypothetical protein